MGDVPLIQVQGGFIMDPNRHISGD
jgi:hypothetical protein